MEKVTLKEDSKKETITLARMKQKKKSKQR